MKIESLHSLILRAKSPDEWSYIQGIISKWLDDYLDQKSCAEDDSKEYYFYDSIRLLIEEILRTHDLAEKILDRSSS